MTRDQLIQAVLGVKRWNRNDQRAPHKPLMIAYTLAQYILGHGQYLDFVTEVDAQVNVLLRRFGPTRKAYHCHYGFWRLINDGFWSLLNASTCLPRKSNTDPPKSELVKHRVKGGFCDEAYQLLHDSPQFTLELLETVLLANFPESMVPDIMAHLGLEFSAGFVRRIKRDPNFRSNILRAYNYQCAICSYDLRLDETSFGLEAAHIKWKQFHGPCDVDNGMSLCALHHKAFDKGAISINSNLELLISPTLNGGSVSEMLFWQFEGKQIYLPRNEVYHPNLDYVQWHNREVFCV